MPGGTREGNKATNREKLIRERFMPGETGATVGGVREMSDVILSPIPQTEKNLPFLHLTSLALDANAFTLLSALTTIAFFQGEEFA